MMKNSFKIVTFATSLGILSGCGGIGEDIKISEIVTDTKESISQVLMYPEVKSDQSDNVRLPYVSNALLDLPAGYRGRIVTYTNGIDEYPATISLSNEATRKTVHMTVGTKGDLESAIGKLLEKI